MSHFLVDVDGVVADIVEATLNLVGKTTDEEYDKYKHCRQWNVWDTFSGWEHKTIMQCVLQPKFWEEMPRIPEAQDAIFKLKRAGHKITWVTAPTWECNGWCDARVRWIHKHFRKNSNIIIAGDKQNIYGDIFIDDKEENVNKWQSNWPNKQAILFNAPYNDPNQSYSWKRILKTYT